MAVSTAFYPLFFMVPGIVGAFTVTTHFLLKDDIEKHEEGDKSLELVMKIASRKKMRKIGLILFPIITLISFFGLIFCLYLEKNPL
ncbi:TPA: hypothetical protein ACGIK9_003409 [Acinetobacter baumannii]|uniref:hypothetical protein n=1 Tax=Acinetobacter baumannii TaxID=470 RepID=UPI00338DF98F